MEPNYNKETHSIRARCPDCNGAISNFVTTPSHAQHGQVVIKKHHNFRGRKFHQIIFTLFRCGGCGRGSLAKLHYCENSSEHVLESFLPASIENAEVPEKTPDGITKEYREAELCASVGAWRAASALMRSTLEKTLKANGYIKGVLQDKINDAHKDGILTLARCQRAHDDIRVLGNDVLHGEWREATQDEFTSSHHYAQRILEDFYDDRPSVESILIEKKRIKAKPVKKVDEKGGSEEKE
jgi:hypothetical protein